MARITTLTRLTFRLGLLAWFPLGLLVLSALSIPFSSSWTHFTFGSEALVKRGLATSLIQVGTPLILLLCSYRIFVQDPIPPLGSVLARPLRRIEILIARALGLLGIAVTIATILSLTAVLSSTLEPPSATYLLLRVSLYCVPVVGCSLLFFSLLPASLAPFSTFVILLLGALFSRSVAGPIRFVLDILPDPAALEASSGLLGGAVYSCALATLFFLLATWILSDRNL